MSTNIGYGATAIRHGEQRFSQAVVNLVHATQNKPDQKPVTVVESKPAEHVGRKVDVRA